MGKENNLCENLRGVVIGRLESAFYRWGFWVSTRPFLVIFISIVATSVCCLGLINLRLLRGLLTLRVVCTVTK